MRPIEENLLDLFNDDYVTISKPGPLSGSPTKFYLSRSQGLELELQVIFEGLGGRGFPDVPPGTILSSEETIEFKNPAGATYTATGMIGLRKNSTSNADGTFTKYTYSADKFEMNTATTEDTAYIVEWVGNLSKRLIGNANLVIEEMEKSNIQFGPEGDGVSIVRVNRSKMSMRVLRINILGLDIYIVNTRESDRQKAIKAGYILYKGDVSCQEREKIRNTISLALGLPILLFGCTKYSNGGDPIYMESNSVYTFGGKAFELVELPPYPVASGQFRNRPEIDKIEKVINVLYKAYDSIKFEEIYWTYWHGVCAPAPMSAVYFAGLCEHLQRTARRVSEFKNTTLINGDTWNSVQKDLQKIIQAVNIESESKTILKNKISGLNQLPQSVSLDRLLKFLDLSISDVEKLAWKHRNSAAHGGAGDGSDDVILNSRILQLMFHRLLAAITKCSDRYIDYYNLGFPDRLVCDPIPSRK